MKKILKSKLNSGNVVTVINSRAVAVIRYSAGLIKWTKDDKLQTINRNTRKMLSILKLMLIDSTYSETLLEEERLVLTPVEIETESLKKYVENSNERLLKAAEGEGIQGDGKTKKEILEKRTKNFMKKPLHSQFMRKTDEVWTQETWNWLKARSLKKENRECSWLYKTKH